MKTYIKEIELRAELLSDMAFSAWFPNWPEYPVRIAKLLDQLGGMAGEW
jgi:hypothetical protein